MSIPMVSRQRIPQNNKTIKAIDHWLYCSACGKKLINVAIMNPDVDITLTYRADCPYCGDHSRPMDITGIPVIQHGDPDANNQGVVWIGSEEKNGIQYLKTGLGFIGTHHV